MQIADDLDVISHIDSHIEAKCIELQTFRVRAVKYTHILCEFSSPDEKPKSEESNSLHVLRSEFLAVQL